MNVETYVLKLILYLWAQLDAGNISAQILLYCFVLFVYFRLEQIKGFPKFVWTISHDHRALSSVYTKVLFSLQFIGRILASGNHLHYPLYPLLHVCM